MNLLHLAAQAVAAVGWVLFAENWSKHGNWIKLWNISLQNTNCLNSFHNRNLFCTHLKFEFSPQMRNPKVWKFKIKSITFISEIVRLIRTPTYNLKKKLQHWLDKFTHKICSFLESFKLEILWGCGVCDDPGPGRYVGQLRLPEERKI